MERADPERRLDFVENRRTMPGQMELQVARVEMNFRGCVPFAVKIVPEHYPAEPFENLYRPKS